MLRKSCMAVATALIAACGSSGDTVPEGEAPESFVAVPFVSAHRGGAAYAPENTLLAFENAARLGVDDFEADMLLTADGIPVLIHDDTMDRTTDCTGRVVAKTYAEIQACDAAYWFSPGQPTTRPDEALPHPLRGKGVKVPTAEELFVFAAGFSGRYAPTVTIEIKISFDSATGLTTDGLRAAQTLVPLIQASGIRDRIIVQSFNPLAIDTVKLLDPTIRTLYLTPASATLNLTYAAARGHEFVAPSFTAADLTPAFVSRAQALGKQVVPWTADRESDIQTLIDKGVDGVITNFPACLLAMQGRLKTSQWLPAVIGDSAAPLCRE